MDRNAFLSALDRIGLRGWVPPGHFDQRSGVWITDGRVEASFPESGVDLFNTVDQQSFWFDHRNRVIVGALEREVPTGLPLVEVGSGSGVVVDYVRRTTDRPVASVEPIFAGAATVARRGVELSFCGDLQSVAFPDRCLPAIGVFDVIEHLEDPVTLLAECRRVLEADGRLLITVPAYQWLWSDHDVWNDHVQRFSRASLAVLLRETGFEPVSQTYIFLPLLPPAVIDRVVLARMRRSRTDADIEAHLEGTLAPSSPTVDGILRRVLDVERRLLEHVRIPFGTSILTTARHAG